MDLQSLPWYGQLGVFLLIGAILLGIFYYVQYSPNQSTIKGLDKQIETLDGEIRKAEREEPKLKKMEEELANKREVLEKLKSILPEKSEISQILKKIQSIISSTRLEIQNFTPKADQARDIYIEKPISINVDGNFHNLAIFFDQLSKLRKIFTVDNLSLTPFKNMTRDFTVQAKFTTVTYIYKEPVAPTKKGKRGRKKQVASEQNALD